MARPKGHPNEGAAARLGVSHRAVSLVSGGAARRWVDGDGVSTPERAVLAMYRAEGWEGHAEEGGLILSLLKAATFPELPEVHADTFVEALYSSNCAFQAFLPESLPPCLVHATEERIARNFALMTRHGFAPDGEPSCTFFSTVTLAKALSLFRAIGRDNLFGLARRFVKDPYGLRKGWPDLTLWRGNEVAFREVKAPGDRIHASQKRLITEVLLPIGFDVGIVDVVAGHAGPGAVAEIAA